MQTSIKYIRETKVSENVFNKLVFSNILIIDSNNLSCLFKKQTNLVAISKRISCCSLNKTEIIEPYLSPSRCRNRYRDL